MKRPYAYDDQEVMFVIFKRKFLKCHEDTCSQRKYVRCKYRTRKKCLGTKKETNLSTAVDHNLNEQS